MSALAASPSRNGLPGAVLAIFFLSIAANIADRQLIAIMGETIKIDLRLSDTEMGALTGLVFALFFATVGLPVAAWADRADRVRILGWTTIASSIFTACSGLASGFATLAAARAGVAVGDAGGAPTIWSLVCGYVSEERRARVIALIQIGAPIGGVIAFVGGGLIAEHIGWRWAFYGLGLLGVILGAVTLIMVPEPRRAEAAAPATMSPWRATMGLLGRPGFVWGQAGVAFSGMAMFGLSSWGPSVLQRVYLLTPSQAGLVVGFSTAVSGVAATLASGFLAERRRKGGDEGAEFRIPAAAMLAAAPLIALQAAAGSAALAIALFALATFMVLAWNAPSIAGIQLLADDGTRALAASLHVFSANMFGLGLGPVLIGALSDELSPAYGPKGLIFALSLVAGSAALGAALCFQRASGALTRRLDSQESLA
jgi:predicted MFS family arabinose efflux permease